MFNFLKKKRSPEHDLHELVQGLTTSLAGHLQSVVLFGSLASGEFHAEHSDINVMVVLDDTDLSQLISMKDLLTHWTGQGHPAPIIVRGGELLDLARRFPIEFLDMIDHHKVLHGQDPLAGMVVDASLLRAQCEHELAMHLLKLRQGAALAGRDVRKIRHLLIESLPSVLTLFRSILRLHEKGMKLSKIEAALRLADRAGFDVVNLQRLHDFRYARKTDDVEELLGYYLQAIEKANDYLQQI